MNLLDIWLLAVALAMDCFTVSIVSGVILSNRFPLFSREGLGVFRLAFLFGLFQALMPLIGWFATSRFSEHLESIDHWIAFALLAFIGGKMIKESFEEEQKHTFDPQPSYAVVVGSCHEHRRLGHWHLLCLYRLSSPVPVDDPPNHHRCCLFPLQHPRLSPGNSFW